VHRPLRHAAGKLLDRDGFGQYHLTRDLLARLLVHRALELLLAAAHRRQRAGARLLIGERRIERQLAAPAFIGARLGRPGRRLDLRGTAPGTAPSALLLLDFGCGCGYADGRTASCFLLGAFARFGLRLQTGFLFRLTTGGFLALAAAALLF